MGFFDKLLGGTDKSSLKKQMAANEASTGYIKEQAGLAREDLMNFAPGAEANRNMGYQGALDIYGQTIPQQFSAFQQGNVGAQNTLLAGMPQMQNAILGMPVDYSQFQPQSIDYNTDWAQQQLPQYSTINDAMPPPQQQAPQQNPLAGYFDGRGF